MPLPRHARRRARLLRPRLLIVALAPVVVVTSLTAGAATGTLTVRYSHTWSPPYDEPSHYQPCCPSKAAFTTLPFSMNVTGAQEAVLTVRMRTNWVDSKALRATPNIIQQGRYTQRTETKISIHSGPSPLNHHAQCRIAGTSGGVINAQGPKTIDVADGRWHTITCIKYRDTAAGSAVQVVVDGVAGPVYRSRVHIGAMVNNGAVDLGGQGPVANKDSIDGQYTFVSYSVG